MHIVIAGLYGCTIFLATVLYSIITGSPSLAYVLLGFPLIISGSIVFILIADHLIHKALGALWPKPVLKQ